LGEMSGLWVNQDSVPVASFCAGLVKSQRCTQECQKEAVRSLGP